jgi:triosephosphate isomerase
VRPLIAGNWKMHGLSQQLEQIKRVAMSVKAMPPHADILICVPPTLIDRAVQASLGFIAIGGENCSAEKAGAFTGDVDADMLKDAGAASVILGHSERRRFHHETDAEIAAKVGAAWDAGLSTIICIGETKTQRDAGEARAVCTAQLAASLPDLAAGCETSIAYEPLWAIGSGHPPKAEDIAEIQTHIRLSLTARFGEASRNIRILYGGSVTAANAYGILQIPEVGGVLIGGASLSAADFDAVLDVVRQAATPVRAAAACLSMGSPARFPAAAIKR